jgi:hypothetical protein
MNGAGLWRSPRAGLSGPRYAAVFEPRDERVLQWEGRALEVLKRHLLPDPRSRAIDERPRDTLLPVLTPGDRRAFVGALWRPFLPEARWSAAALHRRGTAHVYLDVSGSMNAEMPLLVQLLGRLSGYIRRPFWAFSNVVAPAVIERGQLKADTTGGTSLACVLEHVARTRPPSAVIVTDGYIEKVPPQLVLDARGTRLHALVTRDGNPSALASCGLPFTQLERVPS